MISRVLKRDGRQVPFNIEKIANAIHKAFETTGEANGKIEDLSLDLAVRTGEYLELQGIAIPKIEEIQDMVEHVLMEEGCAETAKAYILYRAERSRVREKNTRLMRTIDDIVNAESKSCDLKRENANIDGDTAMGSMLRFGSESAKAYYKAYMLKPEHAKAHEAGDIHIHDLDFYSLTMTCCQIDLLKLFEGGFNTGHGHLRKPKDIRSYSALACIAIQSNQNDMHGGQSIPNFDYVMADGVRCTYKKEYQLAFADALELLAGIPTETSEPKIKAMVLKLEKDQKGVPALTPSEVYDGEFLSAVKAVLPELADAGSEADKRILEYTRKHAQIETNRATFQAMEALVHNFNTLHSRAGAQVPFSSINYGMDTSPEAHMVIKNLLIATEQGLGNGETPIFPIQIFRCKKGINFDPEDPNYDLFELACECSAKRLFPNFSFQDAPFNLQYYKEGHPETEIGYMGCRTRVIGNVWDPSQEITYGRGNLSFTSINLPRLGILAKKDIAKFYEMLDERMELVSDQLYERMLVQARKHVYNFPFLMGEHCWIDSEKLGPRDSIDSVIRHGSLSIGFIGLAEALVALTGKHHGESEEMQKLGLEIIGHMRDFCDRKAEETHLNYSLLATPAEGLSGRFVRIDKSRFGKIPGVTDKDYYTNSFHVPVYYNITIYDKIRIEAPYHALTNAGHISYIEMDGDTALNLDAFKKVIRYMGEQGIGYGSINHPIDRDPVCGYNGIIGDHCPCCGRAEYEGDQNLGFERIRRITGYLVGTIDRFNDAKRAEVKDRVKHGGAQKTARS